jgi:hypothetical protein
VEHAIKTAVQLISSATQDVVHAIRKARPRVGDGSGLWRWHVAELEVDDAVFGEIAAVQAHAVGAVGFVGEPQKAVGADAEEFGAVVVAVLDSEAEARGGAANPAPVDVESGVRGKAHESFAFLGFRT